MWVWVGLEMDFQKWQHKGGREHGAGHQDEMEAGTE